MFAAFNLHTSVLMKRLLLIQGNRQEGLCKNMRTILKNEVNLRVWNTAKFRVPERKLLFRKSAYIWKVLWPANSIEVSHGAGAEVNLHFAMHVTLSTLTSKFPPKCSFPYIINISF